MVSTHQQLSHFLLHPELKIIKIKVEKRFHTIYKAEKHSTFEVCPNCATKSKKVHDRRWITVKTNLFEAWELLSIF